MNLLYVVKVLVTAMLVVAISEIAKNRSFTGALVGALPWTTLLVLIWMWVDKTDTEKIAAHSEGVFWLVLPTLPLFLIIPMLLRAGWNFWGTLGIGAAITAALYFALVALLRKTGWYTGL